MFLEAVYHRPKQNWAYAYDPQTIHLRLRTKRADVQNAEVIYGDKYLPWNQMQTVPMRIIGSDELFDYWQAEVKPPFRRLCYGFKLQARPAGGARSKKRDTGETVWMTERGFSEAAPDMHLGLFEFPFLNPGDVFQPPAWVKDAVFYQIFPERFANGDPANDPKGAEPWGGEPTPYNFFGGDLQGVIDHLDYLADLGITAIYFTPIFEATTNHKYDTRDYFKVDTHFGSNETLKTLVSECHRRGIRVLLDAVFNHSGGTFAPFLDAKEKGEHSKYKDWFHVRQFPLEVIDKVPTYDTFAFEPHMPKLNTEHPEVKEYLLKVARYWIEEVGIDGWRLDVANEVDHQFWREFRKVVKGVNPDAYILGELFHEGMMWLQGDQFDALMNYPFTNAVLDFFALGRTDGATFAGHIYSQLFRYPLQANEATFNLLDSHDTARLLTLCEGDKRKMMLAAAFQLTFLGTPCIYYGDEIGLTGGHDPGCRKCMEWDESKQDRELHAFYRQTIALRHRYAALRNGEFRFLHAKANDSRLVYERWNDQDHFVIAMNAGKRARTIDMALPEGVWNDELSGEAIAVEGRKAKLSLPPYGYRILHKV